MGNFDPLRARLSWGPQLSDEKPDIALLTPADVRDLRLPWLSRFSSETLVAHLDSNPSKALWVPKTGEYIVAERWRHRDDITNIVEVTARKGKVALVSALLARLREDGSLLALVAEDVWNDQPRLYTEQGFALLEKIVFFQKNLKGPDSFGETERLPLLDYQVAEPDDLDVLIALDNDSFPWLWWNSKEDMAAYLLADGVSVYIARKHEERGRGEPVGYASFTMYNGWAHLDRLAVISSEQGHRYGAAQLSHALGAMTTLGATHVGLSTQEHNVQSHRLYKGFGFTQTRDSMSIYGKSRQV